MKRLAVTNLGIIKVNAETREEAEEKVSKLIEKDEEVLYFLREDELT